MPFADLFKTYPNRNAELRSIAMTCYEFGKTIAREPSAALSTGIDVHAIKRQKAYIEYVGKLVDAIYKNPNSLEPAARSMGLVVQITPAFPRGGGPGIASD